MEPLLPEDWQPEEPSVPFPVFNAAKLNNDTQAPVVKLARERGVPSEVVGRNMDDFRANKVMDDFLKGQYDRVAPMTYEWIQKDDNAKVALDQVQVLADMEKAYQKSTDPWEALKEAFRNSGETTKLGIEKFQSSAQILLLDNFMPSNPGEPDEGLTFSNTFGKIASKHLNPIKHLLGAVADSGLPGFEKLPDMKEQLIESAMAEMEKNDEEIRKLTPENLNMWQSGLRSGYESLLTNAPGLVAALVTKNPGFMLGPMTAYTGVSSYGEGRKEGMGQAAASVYGAIDAAIEYATEKLPIEELLKIPGLKGNFKKAMGNIGSFLAYENIGEQFATLGQSMNALAFGLDEELKNAKTLGEAVEIQAHRQGVTLFAALFGSIAQGGIATAYGTAEQLMSKKTGRLSEELASHFNEQDRIDRIISLSQSNVLTERDIEAARDHADTTSDSAKVYVDAEQLQEMRDAGVQLPASVLDQIDAAVETGDDVTISMADFVTEVVPNEELLTGLRDYIRLDENGISRSSFLGDDKYLNKLMSDAQIDQDEYDASRDIYEKTRDAIVATGRQGAFTSRYSAQIIPAFLARASKERGVPIQELYDKMSLKIFGPAGNKGGDVPRETILDQDFVRSPEFQNWFGESQAVDESGVPRRMYRGDDKDHDQLKQGRAGAIFFSESPEFAGSFAEGGGGNVSPVYLKTENLFDFIGNEKHRALAIQMFNEQGGWSETYEDDLEGSGRETFDYDPETDQDWEIFDEPNVGLMYALREMGYDGIRFVDADGVSPAIAVFEPNQVKSAIGNDGNYDPNNPNILKQARPVSPSGTVQTTYRGREVQVKAAKPLEIDSGAVMALSELIEVAEQIAAGPSTISTRNPNVKHDRFLPGHHPLNDDLRSDYNAFLQNPNSVAQAAALIEQHYQTYRPAPGANTPEKVIERMIRQFTDNLLWMYDQTDEVFRERAKQWYDGARKLSDQWAERFGVEPEQVAGIIAALSPNTDWFQNMSMAERVLDIMSGSAEHVWDPGMEETANRIYGDPKFKKLLNLIKGKTLQQAIDIGSIEAAMWVRTYDQAHNDTSYAILSPEGHVLGPATKKDGGENTIKWQSNSFIAKAIDIYLDGSRANISKKMGGQHKIRNFYNNIIAPQEDGYITVDTHAVAAANLAPFGGSAREVMHNFGNNLPGEKGPTNSGPLGISGLYPIYAEAYQRAAKQRGILAREMQSITWEAIRVLFPQGFKSKKNLTKIDILWSKYRSGRQSLETTRELIKEAAGGFGEPSWSGLYGQDDGPNGVATYEANVSGAGVPGQTSDTGERVGVRPGVRVPQGTGRSGLLESDAGRGPGTPKSLIENTPELLEYLKEIGFDSVRIDGQTASLYPMESASGEELVENNYNDQQEFGDVVIEEDIVDDRTGQEMTAETPIQKIWDKTVKRRNIAEKLVRCVSG